MINLLRSDLKRNILSAYFLIAVLIFVASGLINYIVNFKGLGVNPGALTVFLHSTMLDYSVFEYTAPFIAVIPVGISYYYNVSSGYFRQEALRISPRNYSIVKAINSIITGAITFLAGSIIFFLICVFIDPSMSIRIYPSSYFASFQDVYNYSILNYVLLVIANMTIYGALYAFLCVGISSISNNLIAAITLPALFYLFTSILSAIKINGFGLLPTHTFYLSNTSTVDLIKDYIIVLLIGICLYVGGHRKRFLKEYRGSKMKKKGMLCCIVLAVLFVANGCVKTPDITVIVDKNNLEQTIKDNETENNPNENETAIINYNWPSSYSGEIEGLSNFQIDADVIASDTKYYPVKKARETAYSASQIETVINKLANGTKLYRYEDVINTKEILEEQILMQKRLIHDVESGNNKSFAGSIEQLNNYLNELETKFETAPSQASLEPVDEFSKFINADAGLQLASLDNEKNFIVSNNGLRFVRFYINPCEDITALKEGESISTIKLSRADSEKQAKDIIDTLGYADMLLSETSSGVYLEDYSEENENNVNSVYYFYFTRSIGSMPINYEETEIASYPSSVGENTYSQPWSYEFISIAIDQSGVKEIIINGNIEIEDTVSENVKLLDFNEMIEKAKSAIKQRYVYDNDAGQAKEQHKYNIDTIKLGYMQVVSQDNPDEFMIIPVWDFFGTEYINGEELPRRYHSYLTVNAIDGSVIDRLRGY